MRYFLELAFNGKAYHGWQIQPQSISVQEVLEKSISTLLRTPTTIVGAGRTDAGVHATQIFVHFDTVVELNPEQFAYKLNAILPKDIAITHVFRVTDEAHARFDAIQRSYEYKIVTHKNAFLYDSVYYVKQDLEVDKMNQAAQILLQYTDFQCFSKVKTDVYTYNCNIYKAEWHWQDQELVFCITANRFLRNMVRAIVGTLLEIGLGKKDVAAMHQIILSKNRSQAGVSVPAHALYLTQVIYPDTIFYER